MKLRTRFRSRVVAFGWIVSLLSFASQNASSDPIIHGDQQLVDVVIAALHTNRDSLRRGECVASMEYRTPDVATKAEMQLLWDGESSYSSYDYIEDYLIGELPDQDGSGAQFVSNGQMTIFLRDMAVCETRPFRREWMSFRTACPRDICFHMAHYPSVPWTHFFESWSHGKSIEIVQAGDSINAKLISSETGYMRMEFSLSKGCNVVRWEMCDDDDRILAWQRQEWTEVDGVFVPAVSEHEWHEGGTGCEFRIEYSQFNVNPSDSRDAFTTAALELPRGTMLLTKDELGRPIGENGFVGVPNRDEEQQLERLIDEARSQGFASPDRQVD